MSASREEVYLYKYDLTDGMAATMGPQMLGMQELEGVWHTAVVCFDHEYLFDGDTGIETCDSPGHTEFGPVDHVISMGFTTKTRAEFEAWNAQQNESAFRGNTYQWFNHNCNHYTHEALLFLTGNGAPDDVINMVPNIAEAPLATLLIGFLVPGGVAALPPGIRPERDPRARDFLEAEQKRRERRNGGGNGGQHAPRIGLPHGGPVDSSGGPSIVEEVADDDGADADAVRTEDMQRTDAMLAAVHRIISRAVEEHSGSHVSPEVEGELLAALHCFTKLLKDVVTDTEQYSSPTTDDTAASFNSARRQTQCRAFRVSTVDSDEYDTLKRLDGCEWLLAAGWREDVSATGRLWYALSPSHVASSLQAYRGLLGLVCHLIERVEERHMQRFLDDDDVAAAVGGTTPAKAPRHADPAASSSPPVRSPPRTPAPSPAAGMHRAHSTTSRQSTGSPPPPPNDRVRDAPLDLDPEDGLLRVEPFRSVSSFLAWDCTVDRAVPTAAFDETAEARRHANRTNIAANGADAKEILVIHDMAGGYHSDSIVSCNVRGTNARWAAASSSRRLQDIPYVPCYWDCVDGVVYFSHALVSPPPPQWTTAAHRHGVRSYGTIKTTDGPDGDLFQALVDDGAGADASAIVSRLVALCVYLGFDGWMVDVQQAVAPGPKLDLLHAFMAALKESMDDIGCRVILYDSITDNGDLASSFALSSANARLTAQCHSFVAHYGHHRPVSSQTSPTANSPSTNKGARSLPCIDVFGRGMRDGGDATPSSLRKLLTDNADGVCLFAPAWTVERLAGDATVDAALASDFKLWAKLHELIVSDDANLRTVEHLPWAMRYDAGVAADGTSQLYSQGTTVLAVPAVGKLVLAPGAPTTTALALGGTGDMGPVLVNISAAALNNAHAAACSRTGVARANSDKIDRYLVVTVCFQAPASGTTAALDITGDGELATALRLAGTVAATTTPNARALDHCYESVSSDGWITRRFAVRALPAHHTFTRALKVRCNVIPACTGALQDNGRLLLSSIAVDVVPVSNPNGRVADAAALPPRPSPLSNTNSLGRSFPGGVDPTTLCCVSGSGVRVDKAIVVELAVVAKHIDSANGPRSASEAKSYFLRPDGFAPATVNVLVQGEVLARIAVPASGALVSIPLPPGLQSLPPHVAIEYQAIDVAGNVGGVRPLAIAVAAAV